MPEEIQRAYRVEGRVQGVGFRWWTRREATARGIAGTVRNRADGSVEVQLRGPVDELDAMEALLTRGPNSATVSRIEEIPTEPVPDHFEIVS